MTAETFADAVKSYAKLCVGNEIGTIVGGLSLLVSQYKPRMLAVTGPSAVGKSTFARELCQSIEDDGLVVTVVPADSFLREAIRGRQNYRIDTERPLTPVDFDYPAVEECCRSLLRGNGCDRQIYVRGSGWRAGRIPPGDVAIVDGLFLDSMHAASHLSYDCALVLQATESVIGRWRRVRDEQTQQKQLGSTFRTWVGTEEEIARTLAAERSYRRAVDDDRFLYIRINRARAIERVWWASGANAGL